MAKLTVPIRVDALEEAKSHAKEFYDKGYQQGRADAIDEIKPILKGLEGSIYWYDRVCEKLKHLKEQNKCREH